MIRRMFLKALASTGFAAMLPGTVGFAFAKGKSRLRPGDADWPTESDWAALGGRLEGALENSRSGLKAALSNSGGKVTKALLKKSSSADDAGDD